MGYCEKQTARAWVWRVMIGEFLKHVRIVCLRSPLSSLNHSLQLLALALNLLILLMQQL